MSGVNKVIILGRLGADPDIRQANNGSVIANLSVATSESWTDKNTGQKTEKTEWHRCVVFGKLAEIAQQYLHKGSQVYLEGSLRTNKWQDQSGNDRYTTEIVVGGFNGVLQMLDSRQQNQQPTHQQEHQQYQQQQKPQQSHQAQQQQTPQQQQPYHQQQAQQRAPQQAQNQSQQQQIADEFDDIPF